MDSEKLIYLYIKVDYRNVLFYRFTSIIGIHNHWLSFYVLQNLHCLIKRWFYKMLLTVPLTNLDLYGLNTLFSFVFLSKIYEPDYKSLLSDIQKILQGRLFYLSCQVCFSRKIIDGSLRHKWRGIRAVRYRIAESASIRTAESKMIFCSNVFYFKELSRVPFIPTSTNSAYKFSSTWQIAQIKKIVLV